MSSRLTHALVGSSAPLRLTERNLVFAALIFEYVEWSALLPRCGCTAARGVLGVALQAPSAASPPVTPTAFAILQTLESLFRRAI
jgi:hypothetical protein